MDVSSTAMAEILCHTGNTPPTNIVWMRNGEVLDIDGITYDSLRIVVNRVHSHYMNILVVNEVINIIGSLTFTCNISNQYGSTSFNIVTKLSGIYTS